MSTFRCAICEQDVDMFDHGRLECGTAMRRERDSALSGWNTAAEHWVSRQVELEKERNSALASHDSKDRLWRKSVVERIELLARLIRQDHKIATASLALDCACYCGLGEVGACPPCQARAILSADSGPAKCLSDGMKCVPWRGAGGPVGECIYCGKTLNE